ncbi:hypothetical protein C8A01DRAFT_50259 [Parachaetomium inaequale]|uniref:Protein kinase domain-containing protein n=1 Tax=Parachaetomium inaequale TaxID=2588326 RepID=A0AAN6P981_9PEZI|nr:hypothetical protein C8A01DRAFT_50259 [Parachaetomium inaequale]
MSYYPSPPLPDGRRRVLVFSYDQRRWLPAGTVKVDISGDGTILSTSADPKDDRVEVPFYPPRACFPSSVATARRSELTEVDRLNCDEDLVTYSPSPGETRKVVMRSYFKASAGPGWWHETNCIMRIPRHPNIVPFDALVIDTVGGVDRAVGFTTLTARITEEPLSLNTGCVFKLKYLEQLIDAVDHLNLGSGIVHGAVTAFNLLIDPATDSIQLYNFKEAAKLGWEGDEDYFFFEYDKRRNDVKFVVLTVYDIITRQLRLNEDYREPRRLDAATFLRKRKWEKHRSVKLDKPVDDYRRLVSAWAKRRAVTDARVDHFTKASQPLSWPSLRVDPDMLDESFGFKKPGKLRRELVELGKDFLKWERPPGSAMPPPKGKRSLSTGEVVDDDASDGASAAT